MVNANKCYRAVGGVGGWCGNVLQLLTAALLWSKQLGGKHRCVNTARLFPLPPGAGQDCRLQLTTERLRPTRQAEQTAAIEQTSLPGSPFQSSGSIPTLPQSPDWDENESRLCGHFWKTPCSSPLDQISYSESKSFSQLERSHCCIQKC